METPNDTPKDTVLAIQVRCSTKGYEKLPRTGEGGGLALSNELIGESRKDNRTLQHDVNVTILHSLLSFKLAYGMLGNQNPTK